MDKVFCNNCETKSEVESGESICPNCKVDGCLSWDDSELTEDQIERQDFVDNTIFQCIRELVLSKAEIKWNIEDIHNIREEIQKIVVKKYDLMSEQEFYPFIEELEESEKSKEPTKEIAIIWSAEDVILKASEKGITLSEEEVGQILDNIEHSHDCELGVTWNTLDCQIDDLVRERKEKKEAEEIRPEGL